MPPDGSSLGATNRAGEPVVMQELTPDGVLIVTLNRPERRNAWTDDMELQFYAAIDRAVADEDVRSVLLTGAGDSFCPGMDLERLREITSGGRPFMSDRRPQTLLRLVPKAVIAAVSGPCAGIGFVQALMADVRFTALDARWSAAFSCIGLVAEDGVCWRLQRVCGDSVAADLLLSSRVVSGEEAATFGLANRAVERADVLPVALAYATELARRSPASISMIKQQLLLDADETAEMSRRRAVDLLARAKQLPDYTEGVRALSEKTAPRFAGLSPEHGYLSAVGAEHPAPLLIPSGTFSMVGATAGAPPHGTFEAPTVPMEDEA
jgi:enoyl-CoA hydratase/carnithine racemase